jgi:hypothetical protein
MPAGDLSDSPVISADPVFADLISSSAQMEGCIILQPEKIIRPLITKSGRNKIKKQSNIATQMSTIDFDTLEINALPTPDR